MTLMTLSQPKMSWIFVFLQLALVATITLAAPTTATTDDFKDFQLARLFNDNLDCGCCFSEFAFDDMVYCEGEDAHLFCRECVRRAAEEQMGLRQIGLKCMSSDGCESTFERSQFIKALPPKIFDGWQKIKDQECILLAAAVNPNLVMCPFCVYAAEIDPPNKSDVVKWNDKEFRCANEECEVVSCRDCKAKSHLPLSCEEAKDLKKGNDFLNVCHDIEEARSKALFRECPKCHKPFYKVEGCNMMACPCGNRMCYHCSAAVSGEGYEHFRRSGWFSRKPCPMRDFGGTSARNERDIHAAAREAAAKLPRHMRDMVNELTPLLLAPPEPNVMQRVNPVPTRTFTYGDAACCITSCVAGGVIGGMGGGGVTGCALTACCYGGSLAVGTALREKLWHSANFYAYFDGWI